MCVAHSWMVGSGLGATQMDDDWGHHHFRKPPYVYCIYDRVNDTGSSVIASTDTYSPVCQT